MTLSPKTCLNPACGKGFTPVYTGQPCPYCQVDIVAPHTPYTPPMRASRLPKAKTPRRSRSLAQKAAQLAQWAKMQLETGGRHGQ